MPDGRAKHCSICLAGLLAVVLVGFALVGLEQLGRAVTSSDVTAPPPALVHFLADDYAAPLLRLLGDPAPAPAAVSGTIRTSLWVLIALGVLTVGFAMRWLTASRQPLADGAS
jgi:hypothetical protein